MEIPDNLKNLYNHWPSHANRGILSSLGNDSLNKEVLEDISSFIKERMVIWGKKISNSSKPFTNDEILNNFRFCNIYREFDKQTIEIHSLLKKIEKDFDLWLLNLLFLRFVCKPETVKSTGFLNFKEDNNREVFNRLSKLPSPKYGSAYIFPISLIQKSKYPSREEFFCFYFPQVVKKISKEIRDFSNISVVEGLNILLPKFGFNFRFHLTEVLIDISYQFPEKIDLFKRFHIGPGAKPTFELLNKDLNPEDICLELINFSPKGFPYPSHNGKKIPLSCENWEGIACEYRKYLNLKKGKGRKRIFN